MNLGTILAHELASFIKFIMYHHTLCVCCYLLVFRLFLFGFVLINIINCLLEHRAKLITKKGVFCVAFYLLHKFSFRFLFVCLVFGLMWMRTNTYCIKHLRCIHHRQIYRHEITRKTNNTKLDLFLLIFVCLFLLYAYHRIQFQCNKYIFVSNKTRTNYE